MMKQLYYSGIALGSLLAATLLWQHSVQTQRANPSALHPSAATFNPSNTSAQASAAKPTPAPTATASPTPTPTPTPTLPVLPVDPQLQAAVDRYVDDLTGQGIDLSQQGVWVESSEGKSGGYQADVALPVASLTKMATTLLALDRWSADYRFYTRIAATGPVVNGVLQGDLVVWGGGDPFYVWESAIALGNRLNELGIREIQGNLVVDADRVFVMNFDRDRGWAGELLRQAINSSLWNEEAAQQFSYMPEGTPAPEVKLQGEVVVRPVPNRADLTILVAQPSLALVDLLKEMNKFSNNIMADLLADILGGGAKLTTEVQALTDIPPDEITFINGSGLGPENQISARGVCRILNVIAEHLEPQGFGLPDVMPIAAQDAGTLDYRTLPTGTIAKTGTLWNVSTLGGLVPQGETPADSLSRSPSACFAILNQNGDLNFFRAEQEVLLAGIKEILQTLPTTTAQSAQSTTQSAQSSTQPSTQPTEQLANPATPNFTAPAPSPATAED